MVRSVIRPVPIDLEAARPRVGARPGTRPSGWSPTRPSFTDRLVAAVRRRRLPAASSSPWDDSPLAYEPEGPRRAGPARPGRSRAGRPAAAGVPLAAARGPGPRAVGARRRGVLRHGHRLDGAFGFGPLDPARDPVQGPWPAEQDRRPRVAAGRVQGDRHRSRHPAARPAHPRRGDPDRGPVEVGLSAKGRIALDWSEASTGVPAERRPRPEARRRGRRHRRGTRRHGRGARSRWSAPFAPKLVLLGRTPVPTTSRTGSLAWTTRPSIKQAIIDHADKQPDAARGRANEYKRVLALAGGPPEPPRLPRSGSHGRVHYRSTCRTPRPLAAALADVRERLGPVAAIVHGAGVLADRKIEDLTDEQFESVYATKVAGLKNLLAATAEDPLKAIVLFSSSTAASAGPVRPPTRPPTRC